MINTSPIFLITVFEKIDKDEFGFTDLGSKRTVAFRHSFKDAERIVLNNTCDIWETCYDYACIEELDTDVYPMALSKKLYKINKHKRIYEPIDSKLTDNIYNICEIG
jgi:hypothetical protein